MVVAYTLMVVVNSDSHAWNDTNATRAILPEPLASSKLQQALSDGEKDVALAFYGNILPMMP